ncbi:crossover junction endodeoxyribonuclease RuvC [Treponema sp. TIM-1]|uniref:crossover junction endodeoxyribonuclease RuvC n=1 Tax=Treponema sp. TIM-1 TaxID=2898417 RepID=UPI00397F2933
MKSPKVLKRNRKNPPPEFESAEGPRVLPAPGISGGRVRRIIGIDPGLAASGWGIVDFDGQRLIYVAHGCIETHPDRSGAERLFCIYKAFCSVLDMYKPGESAIETLYFGRNITSAMPVAEARGVLAMALAEREIPVREFTPRLIKQAVVGRGSADKGQIQEMVRLILGLAAIPTPDHAADALGAAVCCAHSSLF